MASTPIDVNVQNDDDDEYDEEGDSDFDDRVADDNSPSSSDNEQVREDRGKKPVASQPEIAELDSGDEATIVERKKLRKKQKRKQDGVLLSSDDEQREQWRAKTRSMRAHDNIEKQNKSTVSLASSTIDVDKLWEEMNRPGPLPLPRIEGQTNEITTPTKNSGSKEINIAPLSTSEETITIKRQFQFAGKLHTEEKVVLKSSAEAILWLSQQNHNKKPPETQEAQIVPTQRPLRRISRFDPNYTNLDAFRNDAIKAQSNSLKGPKLNVVEKSKMDWAAHVDANGLKEELDKHSKAKDAYLNRMDFLGQVEQRKEDEAKTARQKR